MLYKIIFKINKFINGYSLVVFNLFIILLVGFYGSNKYFEEYGIIDIIAIIFVAFNILTIANLTHLQDVSFRRILNGLSSLALIHVFEYLGIKLGLPEDAKKLIIVATMSLCLIGSSFIILSFESILKIYYKRTRHIIQFVIGTFAVVAVLFDILFFMNVELFEKIAEELSMLFLLLNVITGAILVIEAKKIMKIFSNLKELMKYTIGAEVFIVIAVLLGSIGVLDVLKIEYAQINYFAHFSYFIAYSLILIGFRHLSDLGGVYSDLKQEIKTK